MEVIPRTLVQNAGRNTIRILIELWVRHSWILTFTRGLHSALFHSGLACLVSGECWWGLNGDPGKVVNMKAYGLYEYASVKMRARLKWLCDRLQPSSCDVMSVAIMPSSTMHYAMKYLMYLRSNKTMQPE